MKEGGCSATPCTSPGCGHPFKDVACRDPYRGVTEHPSAMPAHTELRPKLNWSPVLVWRVLRARIGRRTLGKPFDLLVGAAPSGNSASIGAGAAPQLMQAAIASFGLGLRCAALAREPRGSSANLAADGISYAGPPVFSTGSPPSRHVLKPPSSAAARMKPSCRRVAAAKVEIFPNSQ